MCCHNSRNLDPLKEKEAIIILLWLEMNYVLVNLYMSTRGVYQILHEVLFNKPEGVARGFIEQYRV